jgi:transposase-like protein
MPRQISQEKRLEWEEKVRAQEESGKNMTQWCREQQIHYSTFSYWKKQFRPTVKTLSRSSFTELSDGTSTGITIHCQRIQIHLTKDFDLVTLTRCLRLLGTAC